jgi:hypothetical protein
MRYLGQNRIEMSNILAGNSLPGFDGISLPSHERDAWNFDEAQSYLKYSLCQIELDRQAALVGRFDATGEIKREGMSDVWKPLSEMTHNLLPHLSFHRIDITDRNRVQCLWRVHTKDVLVDIDDLSSGEKAVIQLFFPLTEHQINQSLDNIRGIERAASQESLAVLMDEPELHLHPNLQAKVLDYVRSLVLSEGMQFILATHSPSMVELTTPEELYLLRPDELIGTDDNQLVRIATDAEKLDLMRQVFGSTSNITAMRQVLVVEGRAADRNSRRAADDRIYAFLSNRFSQLTVVTGGGKSECQNLVQTLNQLLQPLSPSLKAVALLDRDVDETEPGLSEVILLPVSMVENLLVDPEVIFDAIITVRHKTPFKNVEQITTALESILDALADHEIDRRVKAALPPKVFRLTDPITEARHQVDEFVETLTNELSDERIASIRQSAQDTVERLAKEKQRREFFDGKLILNQFYKMHLHDTGMSKEIFLYECAREASKRQSVSSFVEILFAALGVVGPEKAATVDPRR